VIKSIIFCNHPNAFGGKKTLLKQSLSQICSLGIDDVLFHPAFSSSAKVIEAHPQTMLGI
jgi:hypothetical protein